ncbi:MAG: hypothetical protein P4M11_11690 [Candidatus Pacebacteria bacterium]|nr:hypothetical protein [Candidatus Paceibacterota bacterium]
MQRFLRKLVYQHIRYVGKVFGSPLRTLLGAAMSLEEYAAKIIKDTDNPEHASGFVLNIAAIMLRVNIGVLHMDCKQDTWTTMQTFTPTPPNDAKINFDNEDLNFADSEIDVFFRPGHYDALYSRFTASKIAKYASDKEKMVLRKYLIEDLDHEFPVIPDEERKRHFETGMVQSQMVAHAGELIADPPGDHGARPEINVKLEDVTNDAIDFSTEPLNMLRRHPIIDLNKNTYAYCDTVNFGGKVQDIYIPISVLFDLDKTDPNYRLESIGDKLTLRPCTISVGGKPQSVPHEFVGDYIFGPTFSAGRKSILRPQKEVLDAFKARGKDYEKLMNVLWMLYVASKPKMPCIRCREVAEGKDVAMKCKKEAHRSIDRRLCVVLCKNCAAIWKKNACPICDQLMS